MNSYPALTSPEDKTARLQGIILVVVVIAIGIAIGFLLVNSLSKKDEGDTGEIAESTDTTDEAEDSEESEEEAEDTDESEDDNSASMTDFTVFSEDTQTLGDSDDKPDSDFTLASIDDEEMDGYHRFTFMLESDEDSLPLITASLNSSSGYVQIVLDRMTTDNSGIGYQQARTIENEGISRIYHEVTPVATEEVYQVGISSDAVFYLHQGEEDLEVILDVKYPGESEAEAVEDMEEFSAEDVTLTDTNEEGDARITGYSWTVVGSTTRFMWKTSSVSGNPAPGTAVTYDDGDDEVTVTFSNVENDIVIGGDGVFSTSLSGSAPSVSGSTSGDDMVYVFDVADGAEYRIYRETSPNQMVLEVRAAE